MDEFKTGHHIEAMVNRSSRGKAGPGTDWAKFHAAFRLERLTPYGLAIAVYRGHAFCPVYEGARKQVNFRRAWHVAFDFDGAALERVAALDWVYYFASFGYTTPSHTAEHPKCRVVFVFDQPITETVRYRDLYHALAWRFQTDGIETDPACKDVLRLYYGSPDCQVWGNWSVLAGPSQDELIRQWREAVPERPRPAGKPAFTGAATDVDEQVVREAIACIPAWGDYADWCTVLMAVHSKFPDERGVAICEAWSPGRKGEVARKFAGFEGSGVTLGSLFHLAKQHGWQAAGRNGSNSGGRYDLRGRL